VIDDDPAVWEGVSSWLADEPRLLVVGAGDDPIKVLSGANDEVHIILCELRRRGTVALNDVARLVSTGIPVVVFSEHTEPEVMLAMFEVGAVAFLAKHENRQHFIQTLLAAAVHQRHNPRPPAGASLSDYQTARPALSRREREVLLLWLQSMSKASVARRMRVSENTVKQYVDRVRFKYARAGRPAATKAALLARAVEDGLVCTEAVGE
jgi:DNA-binding NarL/FixJ family response regulator